MKINLVCFALLTSLAFALAPFAKADIVAVPAPLLQYNPTISGIAIIANTGTATGYNINLYNRVGTTNNLDSTLITDPGTGPGGNGCTINLSANNNGDMPVSFGGILQGGSGFAMDGLPATTVTFWCRIDAAISTPVTTRVTFLRTSNVSIYLTNANSLRVDVTSTATTSNVSATAPAALTTAPGQWVFVAATWDGTTGAINLYTGNPTTAVTAFKTSASSSSTGTLAAAGSSNYLNIGYQNTSTPVGNNNNGGALCGHIADFRVYSSALTVAQLESIREIATTTADTSYGTLIKLWIDNELATNYNDTKLATIATTVSASPDDKPSQMAGCAARMWIVGNKTDNTYADRDFKILNAIRQQWIASGQGTSWKIGFQAKFAFLEAFDILKQNNYAALNPAFEADIKTIAKNSMGPGVIGDNNQGAFYSLGTVEALALWPDLDTTGSWLAYIRTQWASWATYHETTENSLNYNKLFVPLNAIQVQRAARVAALSGDLAGMQADLNHPNTRAMITRFRNQIAGSGQMSWYGDAGNGTPTPDLDNWPANFEWAAKQYNDPTFRWAAQSTWNVVRNSGTRIPLHMFLLTYIFDWTNGTVTPVEPTTKSTLLTRNTKVSATAPDKLLLTPSRDAGVPFVVADIYGGGGHGHKEQTGSISMFENNNTLFLYALGYDNRASDQASMVLINLPDAGFPWRARPKDNTWYEASIPTADLPEVTDPTDPDYGTGGRHTLKALQYRWEQRDPTNTAYGYINNVRVESITGAQTVLNPTNSVTGWGSGGSPTLVTDVPSGTNASANSIRFTIRTYDVADASTAVTTPTAQNGPLTAVDPAQYPYVKFWWKAQAARPTQYPFDDQIIYMRATYAYDNQSNLGDYAWTQAFAPRTTAANVQTSTDGHARYGSCTINGYFTVQTAYTRRLLQLDNGTLVVMDTLTPDSESDGRLCGPVWQLATAAPTMIGTDGTTYDATGFYNANLRGTGSDHLLVMMEKADATRTYGSVRPPTPLWANTNPYATYARQTLKVGVPVSYITVFQPNSGAIAAATLASRIQIQRNNPNNAIVRLNNGDGTTTTVTLAENDVWSAITAATVPVPVITTQPASQNGTIGQAATITVTATSSTAMNYQWQRSADNGASYVNVGANTATLTLTNLQSTDSGLYQVIITNNGGYVTSNTATLVIFSGTVTQAQPDGPAASVTGGGTATASVVTTAADLASKTTGNTAASITISGLIDLTASGGSINVGANKTIQGVDSNSGIVGGINLTTTSTNVILRGFAITNTGTAAGGNALNIVGSKNIYVEHCTFYNSSANLASITKSADNITLAWNEFYFTTGYAGSRSAMQIGVPGAETQPMNITLHDNYFSDNCSANMPVATYGRLHLYNNYLMASGNQTATVISDLTQFLGEHNIYQNIQAPLTKTHPDATLAAGLIRVNDDLYVNTTGAAADLGSDKVFTPNYSYIMQPLASIATRVQNYAGNINGAASVTPAISAGSASVTGPVNAVPNGGSFTLTVVPQNVTPSTYQWRLNNFQISGATQATYTVSNADASVHAGTYTAELGLPSGETIVSSPKTITMSGTDANNTPGGGNQNPANGPTGSATGSGGGAPTILYFGALLFLAMMRRILKKNRRLSHVGFSARPAPA